MVDLFNTYEKNYSALSNEISRLISDIPDKTGESRRQLIRQCNQKLKDARDFLDRMELEHKSMAPEKQTSTKTKLRYDQNDYNKLVGDLKRAENALPNNAAARGALFDGYSDDLTTRDLDQRDRLLRNNDRLQDSTTRVKESQRIAQESSIMSDLGDQRGAITRSIDNVKTSDANINRSGKTIGAMNRRVAMNKACINLVLFSIIAGMMYLKWGTDKTTKDGDKK